MSRLYLQSTRLDVLCPSIDDINGRFENRCGDSRSLNRFKNGLISFGFLCMELRRDVTSGLDRQSRTSPMKKVESFLPN